MDPAKKHQIINVVKDPKVEFCMIPSPALKQLVATNEHPHIQALPDSMKASILAVSDGTAIGPLDKELVLKYLFRDLDERQTFIMDRCSLHAMGNHGVTSKPEAEST